MDAPLRDVTSQHAGSKRTLAASQSQRIQLRRYHQCGPGRPYRRQPSTVRDAQQGDALLLIWFLACQAEKKVSFHAGRTDSGAAAGSLHDGDTPRDVTRGSLVATFPVGGQLRAASNLNVITQYGDVWPQNRPNSGVRAGWLADWLTTVVTTVVGMVVT